MIVSPAAKSVRAATPMAFVQAICAAYLRFGMDPGAALRQAQIAPRELGLSGARVTAAQFEALSGHAMQELDDEALGWFSRRLPWGSYGLLCRASLGSLDLGVAIKRWCRHHRLLTDDIVLHLDVSGGVATLSIEEHRDLGALREFCLVSSLRFLHGYASWAIDSRVSLRAATFPFAAPAHADVYPLLFGGQLHFDQARASYSFDERYLQLPLLRDEAALRSMLKRALPLTVLPYRRDPRDRLLGQRVRELLLDPALAAGNAEGLSAALNISRRTLHRQLQVEGRTLQALKDEVRRERATELLQRTHRSIKQIAQDVGFRNEKSFARAFRGWTGSTPGALRHGDSGGS